MSFFKRNWKWLITTMIGTAAVAVPIYYTTENNRADLRYDVISSSQVMAIEDNKVDRIEVFFNGEKIDKPFMTEVKLVNSGGIPIATDKYEGNVIIEFGSGVTVIDTKIKKDPEEIRCEISYDMNMIEMKPTLLNPGDSISFKALTTGGTPDVKVNARIAGMKRILPLERDGDVVTRVYVVLQVLLSLIFSTGYAIATHIYTYRDKHNKVVYATFTAVIYLAFCLIVSMASSTFYILKTFNFSLWNYVFFIAAILLAGEALMRIFKVHKPSGVLAKSNNMPN